MKDCLFCGIISGKIKGDIVYQDEAVVAFKDVNPKAPVHILIVPRKHISTLLRLEPDDESVIGNVFRAAVYLAEQEEIAKSGFRIVVNCGADAGQSVFHLHYHLLGGRRLGWPPG
jgi:histidine triad (HIT) family protein